MRLILAQFEFAHTVRCNKMQGVPFCTYLYVPEEYIYPETKATFYEWE